MTYRSGKCAKQLALVKFRRGSDVNETRRLTHQALPAIVRALYSGQNCNAVFGAGPRRDAAGTIDGRGGRSIH
jgi:hypothetical protein